MSETASSSSPAPQSAPAPTPATASPAPRAAGVERDVAMLRLCLVVTLVLANLLAVSVVLLVYGQHRTVTSDLREARKFIDDYNTNAVPTLQSLQRNLANFGVANPDILPVLQKFGITNRPAGASPSTGGVPPPGR